MCQEVGSYRRILRGCRRSDGPNPLPTRSFGTYGQPPEGEGGDFDECARVCGYAVGKVAVD